MKVCIFETNLVYKAGHILEFYSVLAQILFDIGKTKLNTQYDKHGI